ncbi:MAG: hypothetical protein ACF8TS_12740 [Maioricimonas sp. JB049]
MNSLARHDALLLGLDGHWQVEHVGIDEKNFGQGHSDVPIMTDIDSQRVLEVVPDWTRAAADSLWKPLHEQHAEFATWRDRAAASLFAWNRSHSSSTRKSKPASSSSRLSFS